ncbi:FAD:protein FMN transferase [Lewinella sp. 4G2]|uniref:FAD:protein FMN transferase n=1 Tax=Lewinella sp. 4G2 TaxID=1803372 RepID=UPI0007B49A8E|nr:FAD:protein FMN transferase [Lewinella sp. 4G2]OAV44278.1 hypothetical protein A3850_007120 [Lewinella sp. 4G2]
MVLRLIILLFTCLLLCTCGSAPAEVVVDSQPRKWEISGRAMGSYYKITYLGDSLSGLSARIDSLLDAYNLELSAWVPESKLSVFNREAEGVNLEGTQHFIPNLNLARIVHQATGGAYDPTIAPLVNYWGFGTGQPRQSAEVVQEEIDRLLPLVGFENLELEGQQLGKKYPGVQLDLNASAKGYGVDLIAQLLKNSGRPDHLVDVGGEMRGGGTKNGQAWTVAIRLPDEDKAKIALAGTLPLSNDRAIATSGNYLNYYKVGGETFSHTINPKTGLVERNRLLSASVLAPDCATADAFATACMVLGPEQAMALIEQDPKLEAYFLVRGEGDALETLKSSGL